MYTKQLYTTKPGGTLPQLVATENENMQSRYVVQKILEQREMGIALEDMAVLFRSSFHSFDLEIELTKANIPFLKFGGYKFIETAHVKDVIAYLRVLENPKDVVAWNRILLLIDGVGPRTAEKVIDDILKRRVGLAKEFQEAVTATTKFWMDYGNYPEHIRSLFAMLKDIAAPTVTPAEKTNHVLHYYEQLMRSKYEDYLKRKKDLETFQNITERYKSVDELLTDLALEPPNESVSDIESPGKETEFLTLSTIHSAKGLEWNTVFVIYALDGRFPAMRAAGSDEEMEEERRLMYVACTRAKEHLIITYPMNIYDRESGLILTKPSRFLEGIGENLLEPWVVE
ncbi:MAG TPA: ATP-dependent helicase [Bacteroidota bacterium]|nr:ATP-dependent helicase [Bacteroidota bacterium]